MLSEVTGDLKLRKGLLQSEGPDTQGDAGDSRCCPWVGRAGASVLTGWQIARLALLLYKEHCYRLKCPRNLVCQKRSLQSHLPMDPGGTKQGLPLGGPYS